MQTMSGKIQKNNSLPKTGRRIYYAAIWKTGDAGLS